MTVETKQIIQFLDTSDNHIEALDITFYTIIKQCVIMRQAHETPARE